MVLQELQGGRQVQKQLSGWNDPSFLVLHNRFEGGLSLALDVAPSPARPVCQYQNCTVLASCRNTMASPLPAPALLCLNLAILPSLA